MWKKLAEEIVRDASAKHGRYYIYASPHLNDEEYSHLRAFCIIANVDGNQQIEVGRQWFDPSVWESLDATHGAATRSVIKDTILEQIAFTIERFEESQKGGNKEHSD